MKLYEIANEYESVLNNLYDPETGEVNSTSLEIIDQIKESVDKKCIAVACFIQNMEAEHEAISEAKKKMSDRESKIKKQMESLKEYLLYNMEKLEIKKVSCPYFDISIRKNPPAVEIYDECLIPSDYKTIEIKKDTFKMRRDMLNGISISGAHLIQRNNLKIK